MDVPHLLFPFSLNIIIEIMEDKLMHKYLPPSKAVHWVCVDLNQAHLENVNPFFLTKLFRFCQV